MTAAREAQYLFGTVPADLFKVLAGRSRYFFADLLAHLADDLFGHAGEIATRRRVHEAIAEFIDRAGRAVVAAELVEEGVSVPSGPTYVTAYNRLVETGWLVEYRDRYRKVVDFDPSARLLLQTLLDIRNGRLRSYGGAVLNVLTLLESVENDPLAKALNVREAALAARGFMNHLRTVASTMRRVEDLIMSQPTAAALVRRFVTDFITATVVQDYRNLHARESPFRFRSNIIATGDKLLENDEALVLVAEGWIRGGIATDVGTAHEEIISDIRQTMTVFALIDDHVGDIEETTFRIEKRMTNVVRFSDRMATVTTDRLLVALGLLGSSGLAPDTEVAARVRVLTESLPLSAAQMYMPARRRSEPAERVVEVREPDPALVRYLAALDAFDERVRVTPARLAAYIDHAMAQGDEVVARDLPVESVDDFLAFERLHEAGLAPLDGRYIYEELSEQVANDWVERKDFVIRRKATADG